MLMKLILKFDVQSKNEIKHSMWAELKLYLRTQISFGVMSFDSDCIAQPVYVFPNTLENKRRHVLVYLFKNVLIRM